MNHSLVRQGRGAHLHETAAVRWSWGLLLLAFPLAFLAVGLIEYLADLVGTEMGMAANAEEARTQEWLNVILYVSLLGPWTASVVVGALAWLRDRDALALTGGVLSGLLAVGGTTMVLIT